MITLLVSFYAQDPGPAVESARFWIPAIDNVVALDGRYEGFTPLGDGSAPVFATEHAKRNELLRLALPHAAPDRWLLILDCDERVTYASPQLPGQLARHEGDVAGVRFIEPLPPDDSDVKGLLAGLGQPGRRFRDAVHPAIPRLIRHLPGLEYQRRHDLIVDRDSGRRLLGWPTEGFEWPEPVDLELVHLWWDISRDRRAAKARYYSGPTRQAENVPWAPQESQEPHDAESGWA